MPSLPWASSSRKAAHIWRTASEKPDSKIAPGDGGIGGLGTEVEDAPGLRRAGLVGEPAERLGLLGRKRHRSVGAVHLDDPRVRLARRDPLRLDPEREGLAVLLRLTKKKRVVPGVAGSRSTAPVGSLPDDVGEDRAHVLRVPARAKRQVERVHPEVAHDPVLAVLGRASLPVDRLPRIEVARVQESRAHLEHAPVAALGDPAPDALSSRVEGKLRGAADEELGMRRDLRADRPVRRQVDAERLLAEQVLPGPEAGRVDLLVEVVRDGAVDGLDRVVREELPVVGDQPRSRLQPLVPAEHLRAHVADGRELRPHSQHVEMRPARSRARELAAHEAAADEAETDDPLRHGRRGRRAPARRARPRARSTSARASSRPGRRAGRRCGRRRSRRRPA